jgi:hypothetical protein
MTRFLADGRGIILRCVWVDEDHEPRICQLGERTGSALPSTVCINLETFPNADVWRTV